MSIFDDIDIGEEDILGLDTNTAKVSESADRSMGGDPMTLREVALSAYDAGRCVVPPMQDGSKGPLGTWKRYQSTRPTRAQVERWYAAPGRTGIGYVGGAVSGGLELFEFEGRAVEAGILQRFCDDAKADPKLTEIINRISKGWVEKSPSGGVHLHYLSVETGCVKLAKRADGRDLIETKGEGGFFIGAPTNGKVHPKGGAWEAFVGSPATVATITVEERALLFDHARRYHEQPTKKQVDTEPTGDDWEEVRPSRTGDSWMDATIDDYNARTTWASVLAGTFDHLYDEGTIAYWHYIGAENRVGATTNAKATDTLIVFSGTAAGDGWEIYDGNRKTPSYDRFSAHVLITKGRLDTATRTEVARTLRQDGYGPTPSTTTPPPPNMDAETGKKVGGGTEPPPTPPRNSGHAAAERLSTSLLDFDSEFWSIDFEAEDFLVEPILARGRGHLVYSPAKAGKSLFALYVAACAATGRRVLDQPAGAPIRVMYVDMEMTRADVRERLADMEFSAADDLSNLIYYLLPSLAMLDTAQGGAELVALAVHHGVDLVVIDTISRAVHGEENANDTAQDFARFTGTPLKAAGITLLRVDHAGRDLERGARGGSAKVDDVDVVWQLIPRDRGRFTLKATHRRIAWVPEVVELEQSTEPLAYRTSDSSWPAGTKAASDLLDRLGVPTEHGKGRARKALTAAGESLGNEVLMAAIRFRRSNLVQVVEVTP